MRLNDSTSPLGAVARGLGAGLIGTGVMTAVQTAVMKAQGSESSDMPAQVGKRISEGVFKQPVPREKMGTLNNAMHFGYGTSWGALYGLTEGTLHPRSSTLDGLLFGTVVWGASLLELPAMKLAPPVWEYPPKQLAMDLGYHLAYGLGTAVGYRVLDRG